MNTSLKVGIALLATSLVLRVGEELVWPSISRIPFDSPAKLPLLTIRGLCVFLVPVLMLAGVVMAIVGAVNNKR